MLAINNKSLLEHVWQEEGIGAKDEVRTRDLNLGKVALYQLSYFRLLLFAVNGANIVSFVFLSNKISKKSAFFYNSLLFNISIIREVSYPLPIA
jgi:hypothetical protein